MAITLSQRFLNELNAGVNIPDVIIELTLDSGTVKWGKHQTFKDVIPCIKSVSSFQNKLDTKSGFTTRGELKVIISGRDNFKSLIKDNYLKNRVVIRKDGFVTPDFLYTDYASTYTGIISDWSRKGDELTITVSDELKTASNKIPEENTTNTQYINYFNMAPDLIMLDILNTQLGISTANIDVNKFNTEKAAWLNGWKFSRVLTDPKEATEYLNELQIETNSFIIHDGEKISLKVFSPSLPGETIEEWTDNNILANTLSAKSGYKDNFYNRVIVYYDYDEEGGDEADSFSSAVISIDSDSQGSGQWNEVSTKTIYSKWIKSFNFSGILNVTGVQIYHVSKANGAGSGTLTYDDSSNTLQWTAPGGTIGTAVELTEDGKYDIYDTDDTKFIRVVVTTASLPSTDKSDTITIAATNGLIFASALASRILTRYRNPATSISFDMDINNVAYNSQFIKPADLKKITSDEVLEKGDSSWDKEIVILTSVRPDMANHKVSIEAIETKMYHQFGFIAPAGYPDWPSASTAQREYAFIGRSYIW